MNKGDDVIGMSVTDPEGIELGFVEDMDGEFYVVGEGPLERFLLSKSLVEKKGEGFVLKRKLPEMLYGSEVVDVDGQRVGTVVETTESGGVLDTIIIDRQGDVAGEEAEDVDKAVDRRSEKGGEERYIYALLEEIAIIEVMRVTLRTTYEDLEFHNHPHTVREGIWDRVRHLFSG